MFERMKYLFKNEKSFVMTILALFVSFNMVFLCISGYLIYSSSYNILTRTSLDYTQSIMTQAIRNVDNYLSDKINLLRSLSRNRYINLCLTSYETMDINFRLNTEYRFSSFIGSIMEFTPDLYDVLIVGENGYIYNFDTRWSLNPDYSFRTADWYLESFTSSNPDLITIGAVTMDFLNENTAHFGKKSVVISNPVLDFSNHQIGSVFFFLGTDEMSKTAMIGQYKEYGGIFLISDSGTIIIHDNSQMIGTKFMPTGQLILLDQPFAIDQDKLQSDSVWATLPFRYVNGQAVSQISLNRIHQHSRSLRDNLLLLLLACIIINCLLSYFLYRKLNRKINKLVRDLDAYNNIDRRLELPNYQYREFNRLATSFNYLSERIHMLYNENYEIQINLKDAKLRTLISQINPHFLFNTLQLMQTEIVYGSRQEANSLILSLSSLFRYSTAKTNLLVHISEEMSFTRNYFLICQKSFVNNLKIELTIDQALDNCLVPKYIIQPLVENSIKHGFGGSPVNNRIMIIGFRLGDDVQFIIEDDGQGIVPEKLEKLLFEDLVKIDTNSEHGLGLLNIHQRLRLLFGEPYGLSIESEVGQYTRIIVRIPFKS